MIMRRVKMMSMAALVGVGGALFQGGCLTFVAGTNPCEYLLNCDPAVFDFVRADIDGPGVRVDVDPFCTFPPFCGAGEDPIFGGLLEGDGG